MSPKRKASRQSLYLRACVESEAWNWAGLEQAAENRPNVRQRNNARVQRRLMWKAIHRWARATYGRRPRS